MEKEIWKTIEDYPNYQISNMGRVKSLKFGREKIIKHSICKGYCRLQLCKEGKTKQYLVHQLVAQTFIPNPNNYIFVNHRDENKQNNMVSNLEWVTQEYNANFGTRNERISKAHKGIKHTQETKYKIGKAHKGKILSQEHKNKLSKPILQFNGEGTKIIGKFNSAKQVERELGIKQSNICACLNGKRKSCGGYKFMYLQDYIDRMEKLYQLTIKKVS